MNEQLKQAIIKVAKGWVNGQESLDMMDHFCIVADYYGIKYPFCVINNFICSDSPEHFEASGAHKTIYKTLQKLAATIKEKENC